MKQTQSIREESFPPTSSGVELTIDIESGAITGSVRFLSTYGVDNKPSWLQAVFDEDRVTVQDLLLHQAIEPPHNLYYRLLTPKGLIYAVAHVILARPENMDWTEIRPLDRRKTTGVTVYLRTIAMQHGLKSKKNSVTQFPQAQRLASIVKVIKDCLKEEGIDSDIELSRAAFETFCSLCAAGLFIPSTFTLTFTRVALARAGLESPVNDDHSLFRVGAQSLWKTMLRHLHRAGLHVVTAINSNCSLAFTIGVNRSG